MITSLILAFIITWLFAVFYPASTTPSTIIIFFVSYCAGMASEIYRSVRNVIKINKLLAKFIKNSLIEVYKEDKEDKEDKNE